MLGAIFSLAFLYLRDSKEGQIKLPEYADDGYGHGEQLDPFDVTKQEDLIDGHPLDAHGFWVKVRSRLEFDAELGVQYLARIRLVYANWPWPS